MIKFNPITLSDDLRVVRTNSLQNLSKFTLCINNKFIWKSSGQWHKNSIQKNLCFPLIIQPGKNFIFSPAREQFSSRFSRVGHASLSFNLFAEEEIKRTSAGCKRPDRQSDEPHQWILRKMALTKCHVFRIFSSEFPLVTSRRSAE